MKLSDEGRGKKKKKNVSFRVQWRTRSTQGQRKKSFSMLFRLNLSYCGIEKGEGGRKSRGKKKGPPLKKARGEYYGASCYAEHGLPSKEVIGGHVIRKKKIQRMPRGPEGKKKATSRRINLKTRAGGKRRKRCAFNDRNRERIALEGAKIAGIWLGGGEKKPLPDPRNQRLRVLQGVDLRLLAPCSWGQLRRN